MSTKEQVVVEVIVNYEKGLAAIGGYQAAIVKLKAEQDEYKKSVEAGNISQEQYARLVNGSNIKIKEYKDAIRLVTKEIENNVKQEKAASGSIDGMKARLSNLTAAYNKLGDSVQDVAKKKKLGGEISTITTKLNEEEQALGNFRRQVGNYEVATISFRAELKKLRDELIQMKIDGKDGTEEYQALAEKTSKIADAMGDASREIGVGASDTKGLDTAMQSVTTLTASLTAMNAVQSLAGKGSEEMQAVMAKAQIVVGALSAAIAIQNTLQKEGAVIKAIMTMQSKARAKALAMETKGTVGATIAQKAFNLVAMANPYVLLAVALIAVVAALAIFAFGSESAAEKQERLNKVTAAELDALERSASLIRDKHEATIKAAQDELDLAQAQGKSVEELEILHQNLYKAKKSMTAELRKDAAAEIMDVKRNKEEYKRLGDELAEVKLQISRGLEDDEVTVTINGEVITDDAKDLIDQMQAAYDDLDRRIKIGVTAKAEDDEEAKKEALRIEARNKQARETAIAAAKEAKQKEIEAIRAAEDAAFELVKLGQEKETRGIQTKFARQIADLKTKLSTESNLTKTAREAIKAQMVSLEQQQAIEIEKINTEYSRAMFDQQIADQEQFIANRLMKAKEGSTAEFALKMQSLQIQLDAELEANRRKVETEQMDEALIREKYGAMKEEAEKERRKRIYEAEINEARLKAENAILNAEINGGDPLQAKLDAKREEIATFAQLENETNEERINRERKLGQDLQDIEAEIQANKQRQIENTLSAFGGLANALGQLMENMGEDNEAMAGFIKAVAIFEVAMNTAVAISSAIAKATATTATVWDMVAAIATGVAAVISAVAQSTAIINKNKEPKAPKINKYATGGLVSGPGSGTSDSIPSMLSDGESVMTALTTSMFSPILSSLNQIGGGVPIQVQQVGAQAMGEDMLARAFAKGAASLPAPVVSIEAINREAQRGVQIEALRTIS